MRTHIPKAASGAAHGPGCGRGRAKAAETLGREPGLRVPAVGEPPRPSDRYVIKCGSHSGAAHEETRRAAVDMEIFTDGRWRRAIGGGNAGFWRGKLWPNF